MKKIILFLLMTIAILTACNTSTLSISEIEIVPKDVQNKIDSNTTLQMINENEETYYIIFHSNGDASVDLESEGEVLNIKFEENGNGEKKQNVYKLTTDPEHEQIKVFINGEETHFDVISL